jgi:FlaG/FlaF family flagellin (archaellin)
MKGISDVIAMLLMLVITIGLVGLAYSYISGIFTSRTAVVLSIDSVNSICNSTHIIVAVRNDGTMKSGSVTVTVYNPSGTSSATCSINAIDPGTWTSCYVSRGTTLTGVGSYRVTATTTGYSAMPATIYCAV